MQKFFNAQIKKLIPRRGFVKLWLRIWKNWRGEQQQLIRENLQF